LQSNSNPPRNTLFQIKKISAGEISKNAKGFLGGAQRGFAVLGGGACAFQHFSSK
jgi:hypothetical protein